METKDFTKYAVHCGETVLYYESEDTWHYWRAISEKVSTLESEFILRLPRSFYFQGSFLYGVSSYEEEDMIILMGMGGL